MPSISYFLKDSFIYTLANWASKLIGFILIPLYTRIFTPADFGTLDLVLTSMLFVTAVIEFGLNEAVTRFFHDSKNEADQHTYFSTVFWTKLLTYGPLTILLILFSKRISFGFWGNDAFQTLIIWAACSLLTSGLWMYALSLYRLQFRSFAYSIFSLSYLTLSLTLTIVFVVGMEMSVVGIYCARVLADIALLSVLLWNRRQVFTRPDFSLLRPLLRFGIPLVPSALVYVTLEYLDRYFIQLYRGSGELGLYAIAYRVATMLSLVSSGFDTAWAPFLYSVHQQPDGVVTVGKIFQGFAVLISILAFGLAIFAREILMILTTESYLGASRVVYVIVFALVVFSTSCRFCVGIGISKKTYYHIWGGSVAIAANFTLNWLLIPRFGIFGAAWATLCSHSLYGGYVLWVSHKFYPVDYHLFRFVCVIGTFLCISWGTSYLEALPWQIVQIVLLKIVIFTVGSLAVPLMFRLIGKDDLRQYANIVRKYCIQRGLLPTLTAHKIL